jgi:hypothetical protein
MTDIFESLSNKHIEFIKEQHLFFVGTAGAEGFVNISPKGLDSFRVIDAQTVLWLNLTGSGNETAAHVLENQRMTVMFCSFNRQPLILRLYGRANVCHPRDERWPGFSELFPHYEGARQFFELSLDMVQTSCGYAVPHYDFQGARPTLEKWSDKKGRQGVLDYWEKSNQLSLDGKNTGIIDGIGDNG